MRHLRVIANRPISEPEKPADAVSFMNAVALVVLGLFGLVGLWLIAVFVLALERLTP